MIGLSGLITPSLEEMCTVATEMERRGIDAAAADRRRDDQQGPHRGQDRPLLQPRPDRVRAGRLARRRRRERAARRRAAAARSVDRSRPSTARSPSAARQRARRQPTRLAGAGAREPAAGSTGPRPFRRRRAQLGVRSFADYDLGELVPYIDWTPFFRTWELKGTFPKILDDPIVGETRAVAVRRRAGDARADRRRALGHGPGGRRALAGERPTATTSSSTPTSSAQRRLATLHTLRQQLARDGEHPNLALADFVAPLGHRRRRLHRRLRGHHRARRARARRARSSASTTTTTRSCSRRCATASPRPSPSACTSACARELWGYAADEQLDRCRADRRALPGHPPRARLRLPARPHREADDLRRCSTPRSSAGIELTESFAMLPGSSVCGLYFAHPAVALFRGRQDRRRPARGLRRAQGLDARGGQALARADP